MNRDVEKFTIPADRTLLEAMQKMDRFGNSTIFIIDQGRLAGCLTDGDIRRLFMARPVPREVPLREVMNPHPISCPAGEDREKVLRLMAAQRLRHVPVVDDGRVVGVYEWGSMDERVIAGVEVEAAILCGGKGLRLGELTRRTPKPLLSVGGIPLVLSTIRTLARSGIRRVHLLTHFRHEDFAERMGDCRDLGVELCYWQEEEPRGTAGGLANLAGQVREHLLVMNGDILTRLNFAALIDAHVADRADITVCLHPYQVAIPYGVVSYDEAGRLEGIDEKPLLQFMVLAGVYVLRAEVLGMVPAAGRFDIPQLLERARAESCRVKVFTHHEFWVDIGHPEDFQKANIEFFRNGFDREGW